MENKITKEFAAKALTAFRKYKSDKEYLNIKEYIKNNIINWKKDEYF